MAAPTISNKTAAIESQVALNKKLVPWDAFALASDLEGRVLDTLSQRKLAEALGPAGKGEIDQATADRFTTGQRAKDELAARLGSKGWNSTGKKSGKAKPQLLSALLRDHLAGRKTLPRLMEPLDNWLRTIVREHERSPL